MKAINRGGVITTYPSAPSQFEGNIKHYFSGFNLLSEAQQKAEGLFNVVIPEYNSNTQELGQIYWDSANISFTYPVEEKEWSQTLTEMKTQKINNLKSNLNSKLSETDWAYIRKTDKGTAVPSTIQSERNALRLSADSKENEIQALENKAAIADYDITI